MCMSGRRQACDERGVGRCDGQIRGARRRLSCCGSGCRTIRSRDCGKKAGVWLTQSSGSLR